ncbi:hypothetical protein PPACK8108_LOCUS7943 [Phakopsora pachyrhizi]|uniref:Uncharacterized protein n=1 Tax=Phakopsora pachyrhizi TaxID=170000 RepID=A0AAV0AVM4_PHAPC|nr:hypothetical protein PPACK8108_LOCUS7943 [Phakopsora pachyrhizi]
MTTISIQSLLTQKLGNPLVSNYLDFYPEDAQGKSIFKLSQSVKWLHQYSRDLRVQMINVRGKYFYIYEPAQMMNGEIVVPPFFYFNANKLFAKVCKLNLRALQSSTVQISISGDFSFSSLDLKEILADNLCKPYNEIRVDGGESLASKFKAQGKIIRHVPLNFYADDTSGNLSKQSGLPPHFSNLEFNTFFVGTSNIASALELFTPVNEELNKLSTTGFSAFDFSIQEDVLVLPVVLLFMADSPMHAEITSTMSPNISLQPCRICNLKADKKKEKKTAVYVEKFLGRNLNGFLNCVPGQLPKIMFTILGK